MNATGSDPLAALQAEVVEFRRKILAKRERLQPLKEKMEQVYLEYDTALRPLSNQLNQLKMAASAPKLPVKPVVEPSKPSEEAKKEDKGTGKDDNNPPLSPKPQFSLQQQKDALQKEQVLEYLVWALDDQTSRTNQALLSHVTELNEQPAATLADLLEAIPVELFGLQTFQEASGDVNARKARLQMWKEALDERLKALASEETRLYSTDRYSLYQQYQQGAAAWQAYLSREKQRLQGMIDKLTVRTGETPQ